LSGVEKCASLRRERVAKFSLWNCELLASPGHADEASVVALSIIASFC
jgi:hypothetical protein